MRYRPNHRETAKYLRSATIREVVEKPTKAVHQRAVAMAPVRTGRYRDSITHSFRRGWTDGRITGVVEAAATHATVVEWGAAEGGRPGEHVLLRALQAVSTGPGRKRKRRS